MTAEVVALPFRIQLKRIDMHNVLGDPALVSKWQNLITAFAKRPFNFGGYSSIDDILDKLGVNVILESGIVSERGVPKELKDAEKFWEEEYRKLREENLGANNDKIRKDCQIAEIKLGMARQSIYFWEKMPNHIRSATKAKIIISLHN